MGTFTEDRIEELDDALSEAKERIECLEAEVKWWEERLVGRGKSLARALRDHYGAQ